MSPCVRPWHSAQVPPSLAHSAALGEFARLEGASPPPRPTPPTVADPPSRPGVGIADCAQNPTLALMSAATRQRNYLESRVQCARCERGSGWLVACVSKLTSAAPPRELARVFSLASGALRRRARPRPLVLCVRAPPTPGSRDKKTGGRAAACLIFGLNRRCTASVDATHTPRTAPSGTEALALRMRPPRGSARVTGGMSP